MYNVLEQMPTFPGGEEALLNYISEHIKYPSVALEQGIQGTVMLRFVVTGTGEIGEVQILKGLDPYCDREAKRVVSRNSFQVSNRDVRYQYGTHVLYVS